MGSQRREPLPLSRTSPSAVFREGTSTLPENLKLQMQGCTPDLQHLNCTEGCNLHPDKPPMCPQVQVTLAHACETLT